MKFKKAMAVTLAATMIFGTATTVSAATAKRAGIMKQLFRH